jgi:phage gpG-like protein
MRVNETASAMLSRAWQGDVLRGLRDTMDEQNQFTISKIQRYNKGKGPFPVSQHRLGHVSGFWAKSIHAPKARIVGTSVASSIGSPIEYAAAHEFGAKIRRTVKPGKVRLQLDRFGQLMRQTDDYGDNRAVFASRKHKNVFEKAYAGGKSYTVNIPARAPITHGIEDRKAEYERAMSASIIATLRGLGYS